MPPPDFERGTPRPDETPLLKSPVFWIAVAVVLGLGVGLYLWEQRRPPGEQPEAQGQIQEAPAPVVAASEPAVAPNAEPAIQYPVPQAPSTPGAEPKALPPLDESDEAVRQSLTGAFGKQSFAGVSLSEELIRHLVATVDGLPRQHVATHLFPLRPPPGRLVTSGKAEVVVLSPDNYARYARYVKLAQALDTKQLVAIYVRFYPLFQQAYIELGYPNRYFNDRLVEVIDHLVAAPEVQGPVELVRFGPLFEFQDPDLEDLSAGRKLLVRMGPANAAAIKAKLRELRREIAAAAPT
jgi:Protein of unknown function (DUF3014)